MPLSRPAAEQSNQPDLRRKNNAEIAELLNCHRRTVEQGLSKARSMLGASNATQLIAMAVSQGQLL